jgi:hypothetical protein
MKSLWRTAYLIACLVAVVTLLRCGGSSQPIQPLIITTATLPNGTAGTQYNQSVHATGGVGPYTWSPSSGTLPHNLQLGLSNTNTDTISGTPDTPIQTDAFTVKVTDAAGQTATQPYTVSILALPDTLTLSPANLNFNPQLAGTVSATQTATLSNSGSSSVAILNIASSGTNAGDFGQSNTCASSLAAGANCGISVTFTPGQEGPRVASITVTDDTAGSPHQLGLNGAGLTSGANATLSASNLTFSGQAVGTTSPAQTLTLTNYGTATLSITNIVATGDFAEANTCGATLASAASCPIRVSFTPSTLGKVTGTLSVSDNLAASPQTVPLNGMGTTTKGTLGGYCFATTQLGGCFVVQDLNSCPVGTAAISPSSVTLNCGVNTQTQFVDTSRSCQGHVRNGGQVYGHCIVN